MLTTTIDHEALLNQLHEEDGQRGFAPWCFRQALEKLDGLTERHGTECSCDDCTAADCAAEGILALTEAPEEGDE